jgi:hypothetical protein
MEKKEVPAALNTFSRPIIFFGWNILPNKLTVSRDLQHWWDFLQTLVLKRKWKKLFEILSQFWLEKSVKLDEFYKTDKSIRIIFDLISSFWNVFIISFIRTGSNII